MVKNDLSKRSPVVVKDAPREAAKPLLQRLSERLQAVWRFVSVEVWDVELSALSVRRRFGVNTVRVVQLVLRGFRDDECPLHASALTFSTMMSIVPILALSLALARGLGGDEAARQWVQDRVGDWTENFDRSGSARDQPSTASDPDAPSDMPGVAEEGMSLVKDAAEITVEALTPIPSKVPVKDDELDPNVLAVQINDLVEQGFERMEKVSFGAMGGVGLVLLVWMVLAVLGRVEAAFNRVWGVTTDRTLWRKFTDYLSVLFVLPLLLLAASSLPLADFATRYLDPVAAQMVRDFLGSGMLKNLMVLVMTSLVFAFLIMFMPNMRVRTVPGLTGGLITAILFLIWLWICASLQVGAARMGKIYGSFATLPILLAWVNVSWQIVFLGAESAFAIQNCSTYRYERNVPNASLRVRLTLALAIVADITRTMSTDGRPFDMHGFARARRIPVRLLLATMDDLVRGGLVALVADAPGHYVLLLPPDTLRVGDVFDRLTQSGVDSSALGVSQLPDAARRAVEDVMTGTDVSARALTIRDLATRIAPPAAEGAGA